MSIASKLQVLSFAGKVGAQILRERLLPTAKATDLRHVPLSAESLSPEWLTAALCGEHPGAKVLDYAVTGGSNGTSQRRALQLSYNEAGQRAGLPTRLFTKSSASFTSRFLIGATGIVEGEALFYNRIRSSLDLRSPRAWFAAYDPYSYRSIVLLDDLSAQGWSFPNPMRNPITRADAEDMVSQMAIYHGALWNSPLFATDYASLRSTWNFQNDLNAIIGFEQRSVIGIERSHQVIPNEIYARKREIYPAFMRSVERNVLGPQTLLHQDVHTGNWLRDPSGRMGLYDWQLVARGGWAMDYAYAISISLDTEDRRTWEADLLKLYLDRLAAAGVDSPPGYDQAWLEYRQQVFHGLIMGLFTIGRGVLQPTMQPIDYVLRCIQRSAQAMADLQSLDSV